MKKIFISLALVSCFISLARGQHTQKMTVTSDYLLIDSVKPELQYSFPEFMDGTVIYKNEETASGVFNYNMLLDEVHFISEKGQKQAIANPEEIKYVVIGKHVFMPVKNGYYEIITIGNVNLLLQRKCKIVPEGKEAGYGQTSTTGAIGSLSTLEGGNRFYQLTISQDILLSVEQDYFLMAGKKIRLVSGLNTFLKSFPAKEKEISQYTGQNPVDFDKKEDLVRLLKFCNSLH